MSSSSNAESVHQANLATFRSYRQTIEELHQKPYTVLGDHASLVKRLQDWRKAISHLTAWVDDDRAYYAQARPQIVSLLEAAYDSIQKVDSNRRKQPESNWVRVNDKEFDGLLTDYIKLIRTAFPPHRQARYDTPADAEWLERGRKLYYGLRSFEARLREIREGAIVPPRGSAPHLQPHSRSNPVAPATATPMLGQLTRLGPRPDSSSSSRSVVSGGASSVQARRSHPYSGDHIRRASLPMGSLVPAQPTAPRFHMTTQVLGSGAPPVSPRAWVQATASAMPHIQPAPYPPRNIEVAPLSTPSRAPDPAPNDQAPTTALPEGAELQWDLELDEDELEALDRSEWGIDASTAGPGTNSVSEPSKSRVGEVSTRAPTEPESNSGARADLAEEPHTSGQHSEQPSVSSAPDPARQAHIVPKVEADNYDLNLLRSPPGEKAPAKSLQALERRKSALAADVIDIDELSDDDEPTAGLAATQGHLSSAKPPSVSANDIIEIHSSDDEMEVDELDPSELGEPNGEQSKLASAKPAPGSPTPSILTPTQQLVKDVNELPPEVRAKIRQVARGPMILHYLSIEPSMTREEAEERFDKMNDQTVFGVYVKTQAARRIIDHFKNTLNQPGQKLFLPHHEIQETPPGPPVILRLLPGVARLAQNTLEFDISTETMASIERWRARFVTPAGSHGELVTVELACYSINAVLSSEESGDLGLTPDAQTRTWPDGGVLWAFVNSEFWGKESGREVKLFLSPPPFVEASQPVDVSDFVRQGRNVIKLVHLGGMEHFVFAVQTRKMSPPRTTWPGVLKRAQSLDPTNSGYTGLLDRLCAMIEQK